MSSNKNHTLIPAEDLVGLKYRRCINDAVIKMGKISASFKFQVHSSF